MWNYTFHFVNAISFHKMQKSSVSFFTLDAANTSFLFSLYFLQNKSTSQVPYSSYFLLNIFETFSPGLVSLPVKILHAAWELAMRKQLLLTKTHNLRLPILWALKEWLCCWGGKISTYKSFFSENWVTFFFKFSSGLFEGHLVVNHVIIKKLF